jgi:hypothetical protein
MSRQQTDLTPTVPAPETASAPPLGQTMYATLANAGGGPPDPSMVWGVDETLMGMVKTNALIQVNDKLRDKLTECEAVIKALQVDIERAKKTNERAIHQVHNLTIERDHLLMERETVVSKASSAEVAAESAQAQMRELASQHDANRQTLENQLRETRSKLSLAYDQNDQLAKENRNVTAELREKTKQASRLEAHLINVTGTGSAQKEVNHSLVLELKNLNDQLATERRRVLELTRELQLSSEQKRQIQELELLLSNSREEKAAIDKENLKLLSDAAKNHELAASAAREALRDEMEALKERANHWENVSRLQFRDIQMRTKQHHQAREAADKVRVARDSAEVQLIARRAEIEALEAKLDVVWPAHARDTTGLAPDDIRKLFVPRSQQQRESGATGSDKTQDHHRPSPVMHVLSAKALEAELGDSTSPDVIIAELRQANDQLVAEVEMLKTANQLLTSQLGDVRSSVIAERGQIATEAKRMEKLEKTRVQAIERYDDQLSFLEAQIKSLRGTAAADESAMSVADIDPSSEAVVMLSLGQLLLDCGVRSAATQGVNELARSFWSDFPMVFVTADFLMHETVASDVVATSTTAFLDTDVSYKVRQDAILLHNLVCRPIALELHKVTGAEQFATVARGSVMINELIHPPFVGSERPAIRVHADFFAVDASGATTDCIIARLEVQVAFRTPFAPAFVNLCADHVEAAASSSAANETAGSAAFSERSLTHGLFAAHDASAPIHSLRKEPVNIIQVLSKVTKLVVRVTDVRIDFSLPRSPLLSLFYTLPSGSENGDAADVWVMPPDSVARFEYAYEFVGSHPIRGPEAALAMLRSPVPIVAFDSDETDPTVSWAVGSLDFSLLLESPLDPISMAVPLIGTVTGAHLGVLRVSAELSQH